MKFPKDYLLLLFALTTIGGAVLSWQQYNELIELRAAALNNNERADWQKRLWDAEKNRKALEEKVTALEHREPPEPAEAPAAERPAVRRNNNTRGPDRANEFMALMDKPEMQRLVALERKGALDARYASLFKNLNLTPEQLDKFKSLLVEKQTSMMDVFAAARAEGVNPRTDPATFRQMVGDAQNELDASIKSAIGDAAFAQYQNYEQTQPQRNTVSQLEQRLSYSSTPLTSTQSDQLVSILAANSSASANTNNPMRMAGGPGNGTKISDATIAQAQGVLTAPQLSALQQLQQEQQAQAQLAKTMREQLGNRNQGAAPTTTPTTAPATKTGGG